MPPNTNGDMGKRKSRPGARQRSEPLGEGFARKGQKIYACLRLKGKLTWRNTGTNKLAQARKWREKWASKQRNETGGIASKGRALRQPRVTVDELIDDYLQSGCPIIRRRSLEPKSPRTIQNEKYCLRPVREFFGRRLASRLTLDDCDRYFDWRASGGYVPTFKVRSKQVTKRTRGGDRAVDLELTALSNALALATRRSRLTTNPIRERSAYSDKSRIRHWREMAPTPPELARIVDWMEKSGRQQPADLTQYLAYTGARIGEALKARWKAVNWAENMIHVKRSKKGLMPWVPILPEIQKLLARMKQHATCDLMFPSALNPHTALDPSAFRRLLGKACKQLKIRHVTPHGLRSYFVTRARQSGLTDADIAQLIGDKTGPSIIAEVYGDVRPGHLLNIARKIQLTATTRLAGVNNSITKDKP
jgi:integrase